MKRRAYLTGLGLATLAGCTGSSDVPDGEGSTTEQTPDSTSTASPEPTPTPEPTPEPTPTPEGSEFLGPTSEDRTYVDLQYRDYTDDEVADIKNDAKSVDYRELYRDVEEYEGEAVTYDGVIGQTLEGETHFVFFIAIENDINQVVYASYTGDRYIREDRVRFWGQVLGIEVYQTAQGSENSVPAIAIADMELLNGNQEAVDEREVGE